MVIVGITGGIGSGKSVAADFFRSRGAVVIDADEVARELMTPGSPVLAKVAAAFGAEMLRPDGSLDRRELSRAVFGKRDAVATLNAITHPPIMAGIERRVRQVEGEGKAQVVCVVAPLLFEAGGLPAAGRVIVMWAGEDERVRRVIARDGLTEAEVRQRIAVQMPACEQLRRADWVVDTSGSMDETLRQLESIWAQLAPQESASLN